MSLFVSKETLQDWEGGKRNLILRLFEREEYGVRPRACGKKLTYVRCDQRLFGTFCGEKMRMLYNDYPMDFYIFMPVEFDKPLRVFVCPLHPAAYKNKDFWSDPQTIADYVPIKQITDSGVAVAVLLCGTVAKDEIGGETSGIYAAMDCKRTFRSWGVVSQWAWAASKVCDYLVTDKRFDKKHIAVVGHSRGGKTALWAAATDKRFCLAVSNCSGNSGAALSRGNTGETVADITSRFPYWFCKKYAKYADKEESLPFDQHELLALIAPRYLYVASATEDAWADPDGELLSAKLASAYYEMYGLKGVVVPPQIENDVYYTEGHVCYHRRTGRHAMTPFDWTSYTETLKRI